MKRFFRAFLLNAVHFIWKLCNSRGYPQQSYVERHKYYLVTVLIPMTSLLFILITSQISRSSSNPLFYIATSLLCQKCLFSFGQLFTLLEDYLQLIILSQFHFTKKSVTVFSVTSHKYHLKSELSMMVMSLFMLSRSCARAARSRRWSRARGRAS